MLESLVRYNMAVPTALWEGAMNQKILILAVACMASTAFLAGCAQTGGQEPAQEAAPTPSPQASAPAKTAPSAAPSGALRVKTVTIGSEMRYSDPSAIAGAVLNDCKLPEQGAELLEAAGRRAGLHVVRDERALKARKGRTLQVEIVNVTSSGNAFIGHLKQVQVRGRLFEDGKEIGSFTGRRSSGGGAFANFKGSCSVLGRCLETLAKDITLWLNNPGKDSRIGE
jgi:hypothetical protein